MSHPCAPKNLLLDYGSDLRLKRRFVLDKKTKQNKSRQMEAEYIPDKAP